MAQTRGSVDWVTRTMDRLITLTCNHTSPDPLHSMWTARWGGFTEAGQSIGEAIERILRHAPGGDVNELAFVVQSAKPMDLETK
jgi:hypothetical protein